MICIKCKEKVPIISNLDFENGTISLYCQCDSDNTTYLIRDYLKDLNKLKEDDEFDENEVKIQTCFAHKNNSIELFCIDCSKELCCNCDLKPHQKENHQLCKLQVFYDMIEQNIKYNKAIEDFTKFPKFNLEYISEIAKLIKLAYNSFYNQKGKKEINFTPLKNICYIELRLFEYDNSKDSIKSHNDKKNEINDNEKASKNQNNNKIPNNIGEKVNNIRHYSEIKKIELKKDKNYSISLFNILLIPNSYFGILISSDNKILLTDISKENKEILAEYALPKNIYSSIYNISLLNEEIIALIYSSGSFDLYFINKDKDNNKNIYFTRKKYSLLGNSTNIINQIKLSKEKNRIIVLMNDKIKFFEWRENDDNLYFINEMDRNDLILIMDLNYHGSVLSVFNNKEIIIKDTSEQKNYIINMKDKNINLVNEIKTMNYLAINCFDNNIDIFDMNLMIMKTKLIGHKKIINDIKELIPLPNSSYTTKLISCSDDNTIRIWNLNKFTNELVIYFEKISLLCRINIFPDKKIVAITNENIIFIID